MAMNANTLKANLKTDFISIFNSCNVNMGISLEEYADRMAEAISSRVVAHIKNMAEVNTNVTGTAGPYQVTGTGIGTVS